jgi:hypothetical protein
MASKTDPESIRKAAKPVVNAASPARAPAKAGGRVPPSQPAGKSARGRTDHDDDDEQEEEEGHNPQAVMIQVPAWGVSMLVHIVALLVMALIVGEAVVVNKATVITSTTSDPEEEFTEIEEEKMDDVPEAVEPTPDVVVPADEAVEPVEVISMMNDLEAAPLAVELTDFGSQTAPAADMMATIGAVGGKAAGGLGGRGNPGKMAAGGGGGADTESAVDRALKWIANHQLPDGSWSCDLEKVPSCAGKCSHGAKDPRGGPGGGTALALLPFLGRGYTHTQGPYKKQVEAGVAYLVQLAMKQNGKAYTQGENLYSQGLVGIALSECYAMTQDQRLAAPTQAVLNYIMSAQDPNGGGWRYSPRQAGDTSAVGWQIMALKSGNMAYLQVNPLTVKKAVEFLESVKGDEYGSGYGYTSPALKPSTSAVGLLCRMYLGWKKDNPGLQEGAARLAKIGPTDDLYYDYYATQIMHHMEGDIWKTWNDKMKKMLLDSQSKNGHEAGSWYEGFDKGHGPHVAGRLYITSLATMILEVYYRHLPIYRNEVVDDEFRE